MISCKISGFWFTCPSSPQNFSRTITFHPAVKSHCRMDTPLLSPPATSFPEFDALPTPDIPDSGSGKSCRFAQLCLCHLQLKMLWTKRWAATKDSTNHQPPPLQQSNDIQKYPAPSPQGSLWYNKSRKKSQQLEIHYNCTLLFTCAPTAVVTVRCHVTINKWQCGYSNFTNYREIAPAVPRSFHSDKNSGAQKQEGKFLKLIRTGTGIWFLGL